MATWMKVVRVVCFSEQVGCLSFLLLWFFVFRCITDLTVKTRFPMRYLVVVEYMVFPVKPHYCALVMSCRLPSPQKRWPLTSSLQVMSSSERNSPGLLCPPQLGLTKGHLVILSIRKLFESPGGTGSMFLKDKEPNDIFYSSFDVLSGPLLCSVGGTSNTVRWL